VGARADLDVLEKIYFAPTGIQTPDCLARSVVTILTRIYRITTRRNFFLDKGGHRKSPRTHEPTGQQALSTFNLQLKGCPKGYTLGGKERRITNLVNIPPPTCQDTDKALRVGEKLNPLSSPPLKANSFSGNQEIPHILQNPRSSLPCPQQPQLSPLLSHLNPV
jgi:hypothetical protein